MNTAAPPSLQSFPWSFLTAGDPNKPPIILLHGFLGGKEAWTDICEKLSSTHYCIMPDLPGCGNSASSSGIALDALSELRIEDLANSLSSFIDELALHQPPTLFGYSMGGRVAIALATHHPEKLQKLILEGASPGIQDEEEREKRLEIDQKIADRISSNFAEFLNFWYREVPLFRETITRDESKLNQLIEHRQQSNDPRFARAVVLAMSPARMDNYWPTLKQISIPTTLISGELDEKYSQICAEMNELLPNSQHLIVKDAGHNTHFERQLEFLTSLRMGLSGNSQR